MILHRDAIRRAARLTFYGIYAVNEQVEVNDNLRSSPTACLVVLVLVWAIRIRNIWNGLSPFQKPSWLLLAAP